MSKGLKRLIGWIVIIMILLAIVSIATPAGQKFWEEMQLHLP